MIFTKIIEIVFWINIAFIGYVYIGYPLLIMTISLFVKNRVKISTHYEPYVSLLIAAYNEEKNIEEKLKNSLDLDYPKEKFEIIVASDDSTDSTDSIVRRYEKNKKGVRVALHRIEKRSGKTAAQNSTIKKCKGEIVVFSDAASLYDRNAIRALVRNYADSEVGAVSGGYEYINKKNTSMGFATILFWKFENFIKRMQSSIKTITGCCGCIYSIRKDLYTPLPSKIISDLVEPLTILQKGYRIVFEPEALGFEETTETIKDEFKMRVRVIVRGMNGMLFVKGLFNPLKHPFVSMQLISHKVIRWFVPIFCILIFLSNIFLLAVSKIYIIFFILQLLFYASAAVGYIIEKREGACRKIFCLPLYFCIVNLASLISLVKVLKKGNIVIWQTQR